MRSIRLLQDTPPDRPARVEKIHDRATIGGQ